MQRHCLEVLDNCPEVELIASAGEAPKAHALESVVDLQVSKPHLDLLALIARSFELRRALE